ncbi:NADP-dependent oxidoreductase [Aquirufa aurantiipilula]|uniref:NADP-dependent oxidoreductase n=1 Tax=Aquirufa aurantiipilula TaxID=2696561 RepID=A0ABT6BIZ6_9BACT|nr:NADP-dependent oxidoreductase [Aquirufa aurantiipilula]MDF5690325.1 NADP-dependent oxidoreductase [Aquirufa aurantiipilula]
MKAYTINKYGKEEKFLQSEIPQPTAKDHEVLIQIHATSINPLDFKLKNGEFKLFMPYRFPLILGHDLAGTIVEIGSKVSRFNIGDEVYSRPADYHIGTFAEYIAVNENDIALKPKGISFEEAASFPLVALTAWQAMVEKAQLKKGQKIFIQAGSGGVGTIAIQLAKHLGASVATSTSAANMDLVKSLGADVIIDYKTQDFETILKDYDVVLNSQDEKTLEKSMRILKPGGKVISISGPPNPAYAQEFHLAWWMKVIMFFISNKIRKQAKKLNVEYSFLFMKANGKQLAEISNLIESGAIRPVIDKIYPIDQLNEAMDYVSNGRTKGKVVVKVK